jgi:hypothetical protein
METPILFKIPQNDGLNIAWITEGAISAGFAIAAIGCIAKAKTFYHPPRICDKPEQLANNGISRIHFIGFSAMAVCLGLISLLTAWNMFDRLEELLV